jgi:hypothetical protein
MPTEEVWQVPKYLIQITDTIVYESVNVEANLGRRLGSRRRASRISVKPRFGGRSTTSAICMKRTNRL